LNEELKRIVEQSKEKQDKLKKDIEDMENVLQGGASKEQRTRGVEQRGNHVGERARQR